MPITKEIPKAIVYCYHNRKRRDVGMVRRLEVTINFITPFLAYLPRPLFGLALTQESLMTNGIDVIRFG